MKNKHEGGKRQFTQLSKAWHGKINLEAESDITDEIMVGIYYDEGGVTTGEFAIRWKRLDGKSTPRLEAFDDSWSALLLFNDLLQEMGKIDDKNITPDKFAELLVSIGVEDITKRTQP